MPEKQHVDVLRRIGATQRLQEFQQALARPEAGRDRDQRRIRRNAERRPVRGRRLVPGEFVALVDRDDALRIELAWTGWRDVTVFSDYRPESDEVLLLCRKTDELADGADVAEVVRPQRGTPPAA